MGSKIRNLFYLCLEISHFHDAFSMAILICTYRAGKGLHVRAIARG